MQIGIDYYRILGLPIQATAEALQQAYSDRTLQLPRREYSELAIDSRRLLLDDAFAVLSNPEQRLIYDASLLPHVETRSFSVVPSSKLGVEAGSSDTDKPKDGGADYPYNASLEIPPEKFLGALLILHEVGEYELVIKLSQPYVSNGSLSISVDNGRLGDLMLVRSDIVLTVASACLELGREQWQQGHYENAAESLQTGQKLLLSEGLFPTLGGEIQSDLYKLRPYRILELLASHEENVAERRLGLRQLQEMLQERGGIDGSGDDQSGLTIDDFLRFIQQLRGYLTAAEQQALFEAEAKRPSAVATYLAVYALMAQGYGQRHPAPIVRAKKMLIRLGRRQDVHLEQAVCAILLGQTEEASRALELSQEYEPLAFIREHSQGYPDLLPGLCLYAERWLLSEVFPHFRDLASTQMSLKDYFADEQVQAYLEALPAEADTSSQWAIVERPSASYKPAASTLQVVSEPATFTRSESNSVSEVVASTRPLHQQHTPHSHHTPPNGNTKPSPVAPTTSLAVGKTQKSTFSPSSVEDVETRSPALPKGTPKEADPKTPSFNRRKRRLPARSLAAHSSSPQPSSASPANHFPTSESVPQESPAANKIPSRLLPHPKRRRTRFKSSPKTGRLILLAVAGIVGVGILGLLVMATYHLLHNTFKNQSAPTPATTLDQPKERLLQTPLPTTAPDTQTVSPKSLLTHETALIVIQAWLNTKAQAFGQLHRVDLLQHILATPALDLWQQRVQLAKKNNLYWQYKHTLQVKSVKSSAANPDRATVVAVVNEVAQLYQKGLPDRSSSYNDQLRVKYDLVRQHGQWRIWNMSVLPNR